MRVLVLNADFQPFDVWGWKKTMKKLLGENNVSTVEDSDLNIRDGSGNLWNVPSIVVLKEYVNIHNQPAPYSKVNIYARDKLTCQYCGNKIPAKKLTVDHVIPRSVWRKKRFRGQCSNMKNVVAACVKCNSSKGDRTPEQAKMKLLNKPKTITRGQVFALKLALGEIPEKWNTYI